MSKVEASISGTCIAIVHMMVIVLNTLAIPCLIYYQPFYIWMPLVTMLVSPVLGGTYCIFNNLENKYRVEAGKEPIEDRVTAALRWDW